jgi:hypothetical protein
VSFSVCGWIALIKPKARCCFGLTMVVRLNTGVSAAALDVRQVLRTMVPSSAISVAKLWAGVPSSSWRFATLISAALERVAGATGWRVFLGVLIGIGEHQLAPRFAHVPFHILGKHV